MKDTASPVRGGNNSSMKRDAKLQVKDIRIKGRRPATSESLPKNGLVRKRNTRPMAVQKVTKTIASSILLSKMLHPTSTPSLFLVHVDRKTTGAKDVKQSPKANIWIDANTNIRAICADQP